MKAPVVLVTAALTVAILLAASFLIATGTRGEDALWRTTSSPAKAGAHSRNPLAGSDGKYH